MSDELEYLSRRVAAGKLNRRDFLGRAAALGAAASFANSLLASAAKAEGPVKGGILKAGMAGGETTNSLDPGTWLSQVPFSFGHSWGEHVVEVKPDGSLEMKLAEEVSPSKDVKTWTFKIRKGVVFHNGKELTPADVAATIERHSDANTSSGALGLLRNIDTVKVDGQNVVIGLKVPDADMPYVLTDFHMIIQPNGGKDNPTEGIGTGPYKIVVNEPGVRHVGEKFKDYWNDELGHADQIEIIVINDATARSAALQSGQVNIVNRVEPKIVELIKRAPGVTVRNASGRGHNVFSMFCNTPPFDNNELRLALKYALDREEMVEKILMGYGSVGNDTPINSTYPLYEPIEQRPFDTDKAAFHYKKSGHSGSILLRSSDVAFSGAVDAAQLFQQSAAKAGITIEVRREPGDGYWSDVWNKQPFCASYWPGRATQDQMFSVGYISEADWNETRFLRPDFDKLIIEARSELDAAKRKEMYLRASMMVHEEGGVLLPIFNDWIDATGPGVGGWYKDPSSEMMNGYALSKCWLEA